MSNPIAPDPLENILPPRKGGKKIFIHVLLFTLTFFTVTMAGAEWLLKDSNNIENWQYGLTYGILIIIFISSHEFGHFFAAKYHKIDATLPYYIPVPPSFMPFGTMGAVIKTKSPIRSKKALFDIGVAGPIAGFAVSFIYLIIGFATLPSIDYLSTIMPEYDFLFRFFGPGSSPEGIFFGDTILYHSMSAIFANPDGWLPPMNEVIHYPFLNAGWFGLFVTSLNMLPIGQLDGGHVTYGMFGEKQAVIAKYVWYFILFLGIGGTLGILHDILQIDSSEGWYITVQNIFLPILDLIETHAPVYFQCWPGWLFWAFITRIFIKLKHPPVAQYSDDDIGARRKAIGWAALIILLLSFSYNGIYIL